MTETIEAQPLNEVPAFLGAQTLTNGISADSVNMTSSGLNSTQNCTLYGSWWPNYWGYCPEDRTQKAFRIVRLLIDKKKIKLQSIEQFVKLVDDILTVL